MLRRAFLFGGILLIALGTFSILGITPPKTKQDNIPGYNYPLTNRILSYSDERIMRKDGESDLAFSRRANTEIYNAFYHCGVNDSIYSPFLNALSRIGLIRDSVGLISIRFFVCGYCHQSSFILMSALENNGINAVMHDLGGHVVVRAEMDGDKYLIDPDVGIGPFREDSKTLGDMVEKEVEEKWGRHIPGIGKSYSDRYTSKDDNKDFDKAYMDYLYWMSVFQTIAMYSEKILWRISIIVGIMIVFVCHYGFGIRKEVRIIANQENGLRILGQFIKALELQKIALQEESAKKMFVRSRKDSE